MKSSCCQADLDAANWWFEQDGHRIPVLGPFADDGAVLIGLCSACGRIDIRCNPMTGKSERVVDGDMFSDVPREVIDDDDDDDE